MNFITRRYRSVLLAAALGSAVCMSGCLLSTNTLSSRYSEIAPGSVPVDIFSVDGYKAVKIGGVTWMAENLNIESGKSWCLNDKSEYCDAYGRLYNWYTAVKVCPPGWHLPSRQEWVDLEAMAGGKAAGKRLKTSDQWNGTNDYGFSAVPAGRRDVSTAAQFWPDERDFGGDVRYYNCIEKNGQPVCYSSWWTSDERNVTGWNCDGRSCREQAYAAGVAGDDSFSAGLSFPRHAGLSVRCILDN